MSLSLVFLSAALDRGTFPIAQPNFLSQRRLLGQDGKDFDNFQHRLEAIRCRDCKFFKSRIEWHKNANDGGAKVGGSLTGLMHGIMVKRLGHKVRILERSVSSDRSGLAAGMSMGPKGREFLETYDSVKQPYSIPCPGPVILDGKMNVKRRVNNPFGLTSWDTLYYRLRANFDGLRSEYCPNPPLLPETEGEATFEQGKQVTDVTLSGQQVTLGFDNLLDGSSGTCQADLVIAADGSFSSVRQRFAPVVNRRYAGYVAWRGTVPEEVVSQETREAMDQGFIAYEMPAGYIVGYGHRPLP